LLIEYKALVISESKSEILVTMDVPSLPSVIPFKVMGERYDIPLFSIRNFPLKDALLNKLTEKYLNGFCTGQNVNIVLSPQGEIVIESFKPIEELKALNEHNNLSKKSVVLSNFDKIVKIYINPSITLFELLELQAVVYKAQASILANNPKLLEKSPQYNFIRKSNYKNFLQELDFYGVASLFHSDLIKNGIDQDIMIKRFKKNLAKRFGSISYSRIFIQSILSLGGVFSGSLLLQAITGEDWKSYFPRDLDIYVNEYTLKGMLEQNKKHPHKRYHKHELFVQGAKTIEEGVIKHNGNVRIDISKAVDIVDTFEDANKIAMRKNIAEHICEYIDAKKVTITEDDTEKHKEYSYTSNILYVIKFEMMGGFKVDMIVLCCTVPYQLDMDFDFDFCKVYFDGYALHALNWNAVCNKRSIDRSLTMRECTYASRIDRIEKYFRRGFVVMANDTEKYEKHKSATRHKVVKVYIDNPPAQTLTDNSSTEQVNDIFNLLIL
jgi:hypothetical protein